MPKNAVDVIPTETRLMVCDWLMDSVAYEEIRTRLTAAGLPEEALPSDFCLRKYKAGAEYQKQYESRLLAHRISHWDMPELDEARDWQQAAANYGAKRMVMHLSTTPEMETETLIRMSRNLLQQQSLAFRKDRWAVEKADRLQAMKEKREEDRHDKRWHGTREWDIPAGLTLMDTMRTLDQMEWMLLESPTCCARLGLSPQVVKTLRWHFRIDSTSETLTTWQEDLASGMISQAIWDRNLTPTGTGQDYENACIDTLLTAYEAAHGPLPRREEVAGVREQGAQAQIVTESERPEKAAPPAPPAPPEADPEALLEPTESAEPGTDPHRLSQKATDSERPAQTGTPPPPKPVFANSPSAQARAQARKKRKKTKR